MLGSDTDNRLSPVWHQAITWTEKKKKNDADSSASSTTNETGISLGVRPANERRRYNVTTFLIGRAHT